MPIMIEFNYFSKFWVEGRLKVEFFDSHAHYDDEKFNEDREEIIEKIYNADITKFISAGYSLESSKKGIELTEKYDYIYTTSGISPNDVKESIEETQKEIDELRKLIIEYKRGKKEKDKKRKRENTVEKTVKLRLYK